MQAQIRPSTEEDVPEITRIYDHYVHTSTATYELEPPTPQEMSGRRSKILALGLPYLVAEQESKILGYAYAGQYRPRPGYQYTIEDSVYIHPDYQGQGLGRVLLTALIETCEQGPWRQMIAVIGDTANAASMRLHERHGFRRIGTLYSVGWKFNRWVDSILMQRQLGPGNSLPAKDLLGKDSAKILRGDGRPRPSG
jgi:L-amino acid N-acyltransferase YncA